MPPKKRKKVSFGDTQPGVAKQHLLDRYQDLPSNNEDILKGHVLCLYTVSCCSSRALTVKTLLTHLNVATGQQLPELNKSLGAGIKNAVERMKKFKRLTDVKQFQAFSCLCEEKFVIHESLLKVNEEPLPGPSKAPVEPETSAKPLPPSPLKTRQLAKCKMCKRYRANLWEIKEKNRSMKNAFLAKRNMSQIKKRNAIKTLTQKVKRKDIRLKELQEKYKNTPTAKELARTKKSLTASEQKHKKLKQCHAESRSATKKRLSAEFENASSDLQQKIKEQNELIRSLQIEKDLLEEKVDNLKAEAKQSRADGKSYSAETRMVVYTSIVNNVPTNNISGLIEQLSHRWNVNLTDVPHRTTVECMVRELGTVAELQAAEAVLQNPNCTLGFDATTQEGIHINSIHITTKSDCFAIAVDELPGGTAHDYHTHICESINNLADVHVRFNGGDLDHTKKKLIQNISNTLTDRCAANHATVQLLNESWEKELTELNCHLHPLDSISQETRNALKNFEKERNMTSQIWGHDCMAGDIVLQMNKMRFKDGKGDPRGFKAFLDREGLPRGILPRYRGNRLHVLFHIAGKLVCYYDQLIKYLEKGTTSGGLRKKLCADLKATCAHVELQVLGLIGKLLTGPWMSKFYTSSDTEINHIQGIELVKDIVGMLKEKKENVAGLLSSSCDFFGTKLDLEKDAVLKKLQAEPRDGMMYQEMMKVCLQAVINVLERQYERYFECDLTAKLRSETESARSHNIDAEEIMGMFSALQKRAPNATICYLSSKMRAQKNRSVDFLDGQNEERKDAILKKAVQLGQKQRRKRRMKQKELRDELIRREEAKNQARDMTRKKQSGKKAQEDFG